jgi:hypothetical protein
VAGPREGMHGPWCGHALEIRQLHLFSYSWAHTGGNGNSLRRNCATHTSIPKQLSMVTVFSMHPGQFTYPMLSYLGAPRG